jgi:hypothetical protein
MQWNDSEAYMGTNSGTYAFQLSLLCAVLTVGGCKKIDIRKEVSTALSAHSASAEQSLLVIVTQYQPAAHV